MELIPLKLTHTVVQQIVQDTSIPDANMYLALTRMLSWLAWPTAKQAHIWILRFFYELALVSKFSMLADVTHKCIKQVRENLFCGDDVCAACMICQCIVAYASALLPSLTQVLC